MGSSEPAPAPRGRLLLLLALFLLLFSQAALLWCLLSQTRVRFPIDCWILQAKNGLKAIEANDLAGSAAPLPNTPGVPGLFGDHCPMSTRHRNLPLSLTDLR